MKFVITDPIYCAWDVETISLGESFLVTAWDNTGAYAHWYGDIDPITETVVWKPQDLIEMREFSQGKIPCGHNITAYDEEKLANLPFGGLHFTTNPVDTQLLSHVCQSTAKHGLKERCRQMADFPSDDEHDLHALARHCVSIVKECKKYATATVPVLNKKLKSFGLYDQQTIMNIAQIQLRSKIEANMWLVRIFYPDDGKMLEYGLRDVLRVLVLLCGVAETSPPLCPTKFFGFKFMMDMEGWWEAYEHKRRETKALQYLAKRGMALHEENAKELLVTLDRKATTIKRRIQNITGCNPASKPEVRDLFYKTCGFNPIKWGKQDPSVDAPTRLHILKADPNCDTEYKFWLIKAINQWQEAQTHAGYIRGYFEKQERGIIRYGFNPTGTATTRNSSSNINIHNVGKRNPRYKLRKAFRARTGFVMVLLDYSNAELRFFAHHSGEPQFLEWFKEGKDVHWWTASMIVEELMKYHPEITGMWDGARRHLDGTGSVDDEECYDNIRQCGKTANFSIIYGSGVDTLNAQINMYLGINIKERNLVSTIYHGKFPRVREFMRELTGGIASTGRVVTAYGYPLCIPKDKSHAAVDYVCQAGAKQNEGDALARTLDHCIQLNRLRRHQGRPERVYGLFEKHDELAFEITESVSFQEVLNLRFLMNWSPIEVLKLPVDIEVCTHSWGDTTPVTKLGIPLPELSALSVGEVKQLCLKV